MRLSMYREIVHDAHLQSTLQTCRCGGAEFSVGCWSKDPERFLPTILLMAVAGVVAGRLARGRALVELHAHRRARTAPHPSFQRTSCCGH